MKRAKPTALDGFDLHKITLKPNNGMEIRIEVSESSGYVIRVDSRGGHASVSWDGLACFFDGTFPQALPDAEAGAPEVSP